MITVKIRDPYKGNYTVQLDENMPKEDLQEVIDYLDRNTREIWALEGREHYHQKYSLDALTYEGVDYADAETTEDVLLCREEEPDTSDEEKLEIYLSYLTETQQRRIRLRLLGLTFKEIAESEGADSSSVRESVRAAWRKLHKKFPEKFPKTPPLN